VYCQHEPEVVPCHLAFSDGENLHLGLSILLHFGKTAYTCSSRGDFCCKLLYRITNSSTSMCQIDHKCFCCWIPNYFKCIYLWFTQKSITKIGWTTKHKNAKQIMHNKNLSCTGDIHVSKRANSPTFYCRASLPPCAPQSLQQVEHTRRHLPSRPTPDCPTQPGCSTLPLKNWTRTHLERRKTDFNTCHVLGP